MVVDAHVHVNRFDLMKPACYELIQKNPTFKVMESFIQDPNRLLDHMDAEGIDALWMINYCAKDIMGYGSEVNDWGAAYCEADPKRLYSTGGYDPRHDGNGEEAANRIKDLGLVGAKIHPVHQGLDADDALFHSFYERMSELGLPVIFHSGTRIFPGADNSRQDIGPIGNVAKNYPGLAVTVAHGGRPHQTKEAMDLLRHDNVLIDLSSCPPKRLPDYFGNLDEHATRFLWGSDWPGPMVPGMGKNVESFKELGLTCQEQILDTNARQFM